MMLVWETLEVKLAIAVVARFHHYFYTVVPIQLDKSGNIDRVRPLRHYQTVLNSKWATPKSPGNTARCSAGMTLCLYRRSMTPLLNKSTTPVITAGTGIFLVPCD
jgi:hypothetical protein